MANQLSEKAIQRIVSEVLGQVNGKSSSVAAPSIVSPSLSNGKHGVFDDAADAAEAAFYAYEELRKVGQDGRKTIVNIVKTLCAENAKVWGKLELDETKIGRLDHKIAKLNGIPSVPGVEWIQPLGMSGDHGITMEEHTPFGVIGAITPVTHSIPTISCNIINMVAAGNTVVINPHPGGAKCAAVAVAAFNQAIERELGISNIATTVANPTLESFDAICKSEHIRLLCVTGGPAVVNAAMKSGKRSICAGPGNPPVLVDVCADLDKAASDIIIGAAFDNNLLCIGEKQIFVVDKVYNQFLQSMKKAGAVQLNTNKLAKLTAEAFTTDGTGGGCSHPVLNRDLVGADPTVLARHAGISVPNDTQLLFAETDLDHAFVMEEQMMPMVPVIRVKDVQQGIEYSRISEHGYKHSAMIHTLNVQHMTDMARAMDCTLFVKNGPCVAGLGTGGEGYPSFSVATTTGEGITTPTTFTRTRRCVMVDQLRIY